MPVWLDVLIRVAAVVAAFLLLPMVVGGYGFIIWMLQIVYGPPGPLGH